jgi:hypothetical protein
LRRGRLHFRTFHSDGVAQRMEHYSILDPSPPESTTGAVAPAELAGNPTAPRLTSVSAALAAANAATHGPVPGTLASAMPVSAVRFPGEDGGHSLAEMAQRDLDAALQLLADRAQYITGASGSAIALRRSGKNDMLCRASTGENSPELGALLSTEFGLSGESVRTRRALRCDDAERDARVNREVCRELGIASVVVMPVVNDDEVLGVFELFSGKANAFGDRDLSALQRLSDMVETAVRLARAAENLPDPLQAVSTAEVQTKVIAVVADDTLDDQILDDEILEVESAQVARTEVDEHVVDVQCEFGIEAAAADSAGVALPGVASLAAAAPQPEMIAIPQTVPAPVKKPLFWTAMLPPGAESQKTAVVDESHVPPVLRNLHKCVACSFPVSAGRLLCVECEEKKWRGQLRVSRAIAMPPSAVPPSPGAMTASALSVAPEPNAARAVATTTPASSSSAAAVAPALVPAPSAPQRLAGLGMSSSPGIEASSGNLRTKESVEVAVAAVVAATVSSPAASVTPSEISATSTAAATTVPEQAPAASTDFVFSAELQPSQSWLSANKYIFGALLIVAGIVAAIFFLR